MSLSTKPTSDSPAERPSGWIEVGKLFVILTAVMAIRNSFGVFFNSIENQFGMSRAGTSAIYSAFNGLAAIFTILGGWGLDRLGPKVVFIAMGALTVLSLVLTSQTTSSWQLFFTYSFLLAAGVGGGFSITLATVSRWFSKRRGLALGMTLSGEGVGTLAVAPLATFLIASSNWQTAYLILGLIAGILMIGFALFLKTVPKNLEIKTAANTPDRLHANETDAVRVSDFSLKQAARTSSFWLLGLVYLLFSFNFYLVLTHIVPHAIDLNFTASRAAIIISIIGASTIPGRLAIGWASDKTNRKLLAIYCALIQVASMLWLAWSASLWMFYVFAVVFGFTFGGLSNLMATLIADTFGLTNLGTIVGTLVVGFAIGAAFGPALGGIIFDLTHNYFISFIVGAGTASMAALFLALTKRESKLAV